MLIKTAIMKIGVTGGSGCLGKPLINKLINKGFEVKLLMLPQDPERIFFENMVRVISGDLNSPESLYLLTKDCEILFHLAGRVHFAPKTRSEEQEIYRINVDGTKALIESASTNKVGKVIFYSTVGVFGKEADFYGDELSKCNPMTVYARSKYLAERLVLSSSKNGGPEGVVLRFPIAYGSFDKGNIANLIKAIYHKYFFYFGNRNCLRSMISSENAAEAAIMAAFEPKTSNNVFCITDGRDYYLKEVVETISSALHIRREPLNLPISLAELAGYFGDLMERSIRIPFPINSDRVAKLSRSLTFSC